MKIGFFVILFFIIESHVLASGSKIQGAPDSAKAFTLTIFEFNHAERLMKGAMKYIVTDTTIKVLNIPIFEEKGTIIFSKSLSKFTKSIAQISIANLDSLKDLYFNYCIMITSGNEYSLTFKNSSTSKSISLHDYYLKPIEDIIELVNKNLPEKYKIKYLTKETKQDCEL